MKIAMRIFFMTAFLCGAYSYAHVQRVHAENQFYRAINKRSIVMAFFYQEDKCTRQDPQLKRKITSTLAYLERMSRSPWYDDGDCLFVIVNVVNDELGSLMHSLGIKQLPCSMLFYNSVPVRGPQGQIALLTGYVSRNVLEDFIDRFAGGTIEDNVQERAEQRRIAREEARLRYEYYAPYFYWGYPYWGCGYPCGGCCGGRFGCGIGFGFGGCY
jgi:hypothetical protein